MSKLEKTADEWRAQLNPMEYSVCREQATERPFTGEYNDCKKDGPQPTGMRYCINSVSLALQVR